MRKRKPSHKFPSWTLSGKPSKSWPKQGSLLNPKNWPNCAAASKPCFEIRTLPLPATNSSPASACRVSPHFQRCLQEILNPIDHRRLIILAQYFLLRGLNHLRTELEI